jgi:phosphatidylglycerophosphate synthase
MQTIKEARKYQYNYHSERFPYVDDWKRNPYTFLKARFYMEASAILVHLLLKTKIKPNTVTIIYGLAGILGGILLSIPLNVTIILALFIFFTKGILDWSDGHLARVTGQTSVTGHVLDVYGAYLNDLGLQMGLGFYVAFKTGNPTFYYLIPLIPFFLAARLKSYSEERLFVKLSEKKFLSDGIQRYTDAAASHTITSENIKANVLGKYKKYSEWFSAFLDARARSVDFICLLILLEMFTNVSVTWIIFIAFIIKGFISFVGDYYITIKKDWIEKSLDATLYNIINSFKDNK